MFVFAIKIKQEKRKLFEEGYSKFESWKNLWFPLVLFNSDYGRVPQIFSASPLSGPAIATNLNKDYHENKRFSHFSFKTNAVECP